MPRSTSARAVRQPARSPGPSNRVGVRLYLFRHAHAVDAAENPDRPLSAKGRKQVARLARVLKASGALEIAELWHSPLDRSIETAALLSHGLSLQAPLIQVAGLEPNDPPGAIERRLQKWRRNLAIVGHEPHLSALAGRLLGGARSPVAIKMKKGACLALERTDAGWCLRWMIVPRLLG
jgi:phosphohistidine phosphatase